MVKRLYLTLCIAAILGMSASCNKTHKVSGTEAELTAHIQDFETKDVTSWKWTGEEDLVVRAVSDGSAEIRKYISSASGRISAAPGYEPFVIRDGQDNISISAWHPYSESLSEWAVRDDQSGIADFRASDFMYAPEISAVRGNNDIKLYHQMARLSINIKPSKDASADNVSEVLIENVATQGSFTPPTGDTFYGTWIPGQATGSVKLFDATSGNEGSKCFQAMLIPQSLAGKIQVTISLGNGQKFSLSPSAKDLNLAAGNAYELNLIIYENGIAEDTGATYTAFDLKPGDYFYSDGTWSDGGLRDVTDKGLVWEKDKPSPLAGKTVIGLVFCTDPERIGEGEKEALAKLGVSEPHGLVISTKAFMDNKYVKWFDKNGEFTRDETAIGIPEIGANAGGAELFKKIDADIEGYRSNVMIRTKRTSDLEAGYYPGFKAAMEFADEVGGPSTSAKTTGWYIPGNGQLVDMFRFMLGANLKSNNYVHDTEGIIFWQGLGNSTASLNKLMSKIPSANKTEYPGYNNALMVASQGSPETMRYIDFTESGYLDCMRDYKNRTVHIRCVLAF